MKLRNKKTGEIVEDAYVRETHDFQFDGQKHVLAVFKSNGHSVPVRISGPYNSLAELNAGWEDYEEPKEYYYISDFGAICECEIGKFPEDEEDRKQIDNYFETKEEAEKAVEKLKAWKRLKDKGFQFESWWGGSKDISFWLDTEIDEDIAKDLDLLFGGKE